MPAPPSFPFYPADWLLGTLTFSLAEDGAYLRLLMHQWHTGSVPGDDLAAIARIVRVSEREARALWATLAPKFVRDEDGLWRNVRLEKQRAEKARYHEAKRVNGRKGGRPKANRDETDRFPVGSVSLKRNESLSLALVPEPTVQRDARTTAGPSEPRRPRYADPHGMRRNPNAAAYALVSEQQQIELPGPWWERARKDHGLAFDVVEDFARWLAAQVLAGRAVGPNKLAWLDAMLAEWRASMQAGGPLPAQAWRDEMARTIAAIPDVSDEERRQRLGLDRRPKAVPRG